jgi:DNA-binding NarL/FixJ family response regulator
MSTCTAEPTRLWSALVAGHWTIRDLGAVDGLQAYTFFEVAPCERCQHCLSPLEERVLRSYARGGPGKEVAFALGLSQSTVSEAMHSAAVKLGLHGRAALIQLAAHLLGTQRVVATHLLTNAEQDVLRHLAGGDTNAKIAAARGSSTRTVANQVASVLRKLGLPSRTAAAAVSIFDIVLTCHTASGSTAA